MPAMGGRPANPGEPFGEEAYLWTREHFNQRDVSSSQAMACIHRTCLLLLLGVGAAKARRVTSPLVCVPRDHCCCVRLSAANKVHG